MAGIAALAIMAMPVAAFAATSGTTSATANISAGTLSLTAPTVASAFPAIVLNGTTQQALATLSGWTVTDATGTGNGWHVTLAGSQFTEVAPSTGFASGTSALTLPSGSMALSGTRSVTAGSGATAVSATGGPLIENPTSLVDGQAAFTLVDAKAGYGQGTYSIVEPTGGLTLTVNPSTAKVDTTNYPSAATPYSSTLTYSIVSGP